MAAQSAATRFARTNGGREEDGLDVWEARYRPPGQVKAGPPIWCILAVAWRPALACIARHGRARLSQDARPRQRLRDPRSPERQAVAQRRADPAHRRPPPRRRLRSAADLEPSERADVFMRVYNPDGSESGACGNGTRCVARLVMEERGGARATIETAAGVLTVTAGARGYTVDMGVPRFGWDEIPLARPPTPSPSISRSGRCSSRSRSTWAIPTRCSWSRTPRRCRSPSSARARAPPHVPRARQHRRGRGARSPSDLRVRVWERGAGLTTACGSGACAALVAAVRRGLAERAAEVAMDGGRCGSTGTRPTTS